MKKYLIMTVLVTSLCAPAIAGHDRSKNDSEAFGRLQKSMDKMGENMKNAPRMGDADSDFVALMKLHHQGALDMAKVELDQGTDPQIKEMARKIIEEQKQQISQLETWQSQHRSPASTR